LSTAYSGIASNSTGLSSAFSGIGSMSTGVASLSTSTSTGIAANATSISTLSTSIAPITAQSNAATARAQTVLGTVQGGGAGGSFLSQGATYNNTSTSIVSGAGCAVANGPDSTATGLCAQAGSLSGVDGSTVTTSAPGATAYGAYAQAKTADTTAVGYRSLAAQAGGVAIGYQAQALGDPATAIGANSVAAGNMSVALGAGAQANATNSVALGANSIANDANTVSVGSPGAQRRITNVAPGLSPTDAANMQQLYDIHNYSVQVARYAYSGIAGATALAMIPQVEPGRRFSVGVGLGSYKGYGAVAIGASARLTDHIIAKAGVSIDNNDPAYGIGASYSW
jgi:autotransporter adhesin